MRITITPTLTYEDRLRMALAAGDIAQVRALRQEEA